MLKNEGLGVVLIRPASVVTKDSVSSNFGVPALSLAYLAGSLSRESIPYSVIDAQAEGLDEFHHFKNILGAELFIRGQTTDKILQSIPKKTAMIALTCMFSNEWIYVRELAQALLQEFPNAIILIGGEHVTANKEQVLEDLNSQRVLCLLGEGDETLPHAYKVIVEGRDWREIPSAVFIDKGIVETPRHPRIRQIDELLPNWDKVPIRPYLDKGYAYGGHNLRSMPMLFSRGCPYQCTFCTSPNMWGTRYITHSPEVMEKQIAHAISTYKINHIDFFDLTVVINKKAILELCHVLKKFPVSWAMPSGTRSEVLDEEVLTALKESGVVRITYAPESGSEATLKRIKKRVNLKKMLSSISKAHTLGICTRATLIFGFPRQTIGESFQSVWLAIKLAWIGLDDLACYPYAPYCGSELYNEMIQSGHMETLGIKDMAEYQAINVYNRANGMQSHSNSIPSFMMPLFVMGTMTLFYGLSFLFRPQRFFYLIANLIRNNPVTGMELLIRGILIKKWHLLKRKA